MKDRLTRRQGLAIALVSLFKASEGPAPESRGSRSWGAAGDYVAAACRCANTTKSDVGGENEYGEGVAVRFEPEPERIRVDGGPPMTGLVENYISGPDGDYAYPIMLDGASGENEANPIFLEENRLGVNGNGEDIAMPFSPGPDSD